MANTDWTSASSIDSTISALREMGAVISYDLTKEVYAATNAVKDLNFNDVQEKIKSLNDIEEYVSKNKDDMNRTYTDEQVK
jgi:hypothetical protein